MGEDGVSAKYQVFTGSETYLLSRIMPFETFDFI